DALGVEEALAVALGKCLVRPIRATAGEQGEERSGLAGEVLARGQGDEGRRDVHMADVLRDDLAARDAWAGEEWQLDIFARTQQGG
ncbi:hypothetical protein ACFL09_04635, partial [Planctomycetota bacterium]